MRKIIMLVLICSLFLSSCGQKQTVIESKTSNVCINLSTGENTQELNQIVDNLEKLNKIGIDQEQLKIINAQLEYLVKNETLNKAVKGKTTSICDKLGEDTNKCKTAVARSLLDESFCVDQKCKDFILYKKAKIKKDQKLCENIKDIGLRRVCYIKFKDN